MKVGIEAINFSVPNIYLPIEALAEARDIPYPKLNKGLGLQKMAVCDVNDDIVSMGAQACINLIEDEKIDLKEIGRIYIGTESALDAAKPTATYISELLERKYGERALRNCDVVDMTFACIGAVDAMLNCLDWLRAGNNRKALVVATDLAKYKLSSGGEYTQGAGAVAVLLTENPALVEIDPEVGVGQSGVGDFFKPRRYFKKKALLQEVLNAAKLENQEEFITQFLSTSRSEFWGHPDQEIEVHTEEPEFDGPYSNDCYTLRIQEAIAHFNTQRDTDIFKDSAQLIYHLPYAFQGRRMTVNFWIEWMIASGRTQELASIYGNEIPQKQNENWVEFTKTCAKSDAYKTFVQEKIAPSEKASSDLGNLYTASIFMALLSYLSEAVNEAPSQENKLITFLAYGSGSKSKVFTGKVVSGFAEKLKNVNLFAQLEARNPIDFATYEMLHNNALEQAVQPDIQGVKFTHLATEENKKNYRHYKL